MDWIVACKALLLGIVEGLTEFLPVSSTGHLIVAGSLLNFTGNYAKAFDVVIQLGAILAVCWEFRHKIAQVVLTLPSQANSRRFAAHIIIACLPAVILGLIFAKSIKAVLFNPVSVALALLIGGIIILWVERRQQKSSIGAQINSLEEITAGAALKVGIAQCFALIPGMSRSGSTIIGGMLIGLERRVATEFSFFLAIPLLFGATGYELYKLHNLISASDFSILGIGFFAALVSGFVSVRWLLRFITSHDFRIFAWYRIGFALLILVTAYSGVIEWA